MFSACGRTVNQAKQIEANRKPKKVSGTCLFRKSIAVFGELVKNIILNKIGNFE